jgi:endoglucanase
VTPNVEYPLYIANRGDGKPTIRWTGTTDMDFDESMLQRDNAFVCALVKQTGGYNCFNWQFSNKFMVFPTYQCSQDGANLSFGQVDNTWSHVMAGRTRASSTGTEGWLNGTKVFTAPALDNTIQVNPDGAHGPDYRDQCSFGYYRFTPGPTPGQGDFQSYYSLSKRPSDTAIGNLYTAANTDYTISSAPITPTTLDPYAPKYRVDFVGQKEYTSGSVVTPGTHLNGTMVLSDATKGMVSTAMASGSLYLKGAMRDAIFSDAWTIRIHLWGISLSADGQDILRRDGTRWIYEKFAQLIGQLSTSDRISETITTGSLPTGGDVTYIGGDVHDVVVTISRGKGRYLVQTILPNSTQGMSVQTATNESMIAAPTQLRLGDATHSYYVSRIDVWDTDIQDITQAGDIGSFGHNYVAAKGSNLPVFLNGHNLSGLEDGNGPFEGELDYYKNFGINYYRIPFQAEKLFTTWIAYVANNSNPFPTVGNTTVAGMDATYVQQIDRFVNYAVANGAGVLLDWHSYAGPMGKTLGGTFPDALFKQAWKAIATRWPNCDYDLQNEPANAVVANWPATMQQAVDGIREAGATGYIHLEPAGSFGALSTFAPGSTIADAMLAVTDGLNKLVYHGHQYLDHDGSGRYEDIAGRYIGLTRAQLPYAWARIHGVKLFVGEIGATNNPGSNPDQDREARWFFKNMYANRDVLFGWAYWTGGIYFQDYYYGTWPRNWNTVNQTDRPQMSYLKLYPGTGYTPPGPVTLPVITLSTETDVSSLAGDTTNVYQTDLRIDPTMPAARSLRPSTVSSRPARPMVS